MKTEKAIRELAECVEKTYKNSSLSMTDVAYNLPQYVDESNELKNKWDKAVMAVLEEEFEEIKHENSSDDIKMGDIYVLAGTDKVHDKISKAVYSRLKE